MPVTIRKIKLFNFKRFRKYVLIPNEKINILVGDNEVGKSSILEAIDLLANGNVRRIEAIGIDKLLNVDAVKEFMCGNRTFEELPKLMVELYLEGEFDHTMNGKNNSDRIICDGIRLVCEPNADYYSEINDSLQGETEYFPYDYYSIRFSTFADEGYSGYKKKIRSIFIDSENMNSEYATTDFVKRLYRRYTEEDAKERAVHKSKYRQFKNSFCSENLSGLNNRIPTEKNYSFGLRGGSALDLENDLMIFEENVGIDSKGTGKQVFIKTDFALERSGTNIDVILIEEPENHLSYVNLRKLIQRIVETRKGQLFITTHNSLISTRLELQNLFIMHEKSNEQPLVLKGLSQDTTKYFLKAPVANIVEYILAQKVILVEGPSEFMMFERYYIAVTGNSPENDNVHIMDIRGLSFKRYLEVSKLLKSKVAVVTDNDGDVQNNCVKKYVDYDKDNNIKICYEKNKDLKTYEMVLYNSNKELCDRLFGESALKYMLKNKTEAAYRLVTEDVDVVVPEYIRRAIEWIKE